METETETTTHSHSHSIKLNGIKPIVYCDVGEWRWTFIWYPMLLCLYDIIQNVAPFKCENHKCEGVQQMVHHIQISYTAWIMLLNVPKQTQSNASGGRVSTCVYMQSLYRNAMASTSTWICHNNKSKTSNRNSAISKYSFLNCNLFNSCSEISFMTMKKECPGLYFN